MESTGDAASVSGSEFYCHQGDLGSQSAFLIRMEPALMNEKPINPLDLQARSRWRQLLPLLC